MTAQQTAEKYVREKLGLYFCGSGCGCKYPNDNGGDHPGGQCVWHEDVIALQHWLRVLPNKPLHNFMRQNDAITIYFSDKTQISFNLTTGQPATEADYQALCNILGI